MTDLANLRGVARELFETALRSVDASAAIRQAVRLDGSSLTVVDTTIDLAAPGSRIYVVATGKAAPAMAAALDDILGNRIIAGVISGPLTSQGQREAVRTFAPERWQFFAGGHPLPNQQSLNAAHACFNLLKRADEERALLLFMISGGGSAMMEWPLSELITLDDLREANRLLVSCGASIAEINAVRRAISAVKDGRLAGQAPNATRITLIISDTNPGDEASVASGPSIDPPKDAPDASAVVAAYPALLNMPASILRAVNNRRAAASVVPTNSPLRKHYVLIENRSAVEAAAGAAHRQGLLTEIADDVVEARIEEGCTALLSRLSDLRSRAAPSHKGVCLVSGGEFLCPVQGDGTGGRNAETVLRCAIEIDRQQREFGGARNIVVLSAGTDGIDGNSPAAGAMADETTLARARSLQLDARSFLEASDAFSFFNQLGDVIVTGATGTNVRDVRILLAY